MVGGEDNAGLKYLSYRPVATFDELMNVRLANLPRLVGHDLVELGYQLDLRVYLC